jgi:hypothetical protein
MTTTVVLDEQAARALERLRHQGAARDMSLEQYLTVLAGNGSGSIDTLRRSPHDLSVAEFRQWLSEMSAGMPSLSPIPTDFSRADLYDDHD